MQQNACLCIVGANSPLEYSSALHFLLYICAEHLEAGMAETHTRGEMHGCIVCGKLYELYVVYDADGHFRESKVMTAGGRRVTGEARPLVACERHSEEEISRAVQRVFGKQPPEEDQ